MKNKSTLSSILILIGLFAATAGAYGFSRFFLNPRLSISNEALSQQPVFSTTYDNSTPMPAPNTPPKIAAALPGRIRSFDISADSKTIAFATSTGIFLYDLKSYKLLRTLNDTENGFSVAWSPNGSKLAVGSLIMESSEIGRAHLTVWDTSTWKAVFEPKISNDTFTTFGAFAWSHHGDLLAASDHDRGLVVFDITRGEVVSIQKDFLLSPYDVSWSPDDTRIVATGDLGYGFRRWRVYTDKAVRLYDKRVAAFAAQLAWSPDGERIASIHADGALCFWTAATNQCDGYIKAHHNGGFSLAWSPDGRQLATGGSIIRIWDTKNGNLIKAFGLNAQSIYTQLQWFTDNRLASLETGYENHELTIVRFWDLKTGSLLMEFQGASSVYGE
jgi:WD40 repeat protein